MRKSVSVSDLQFGMYVVELDRPWTDTPFRFQGFLLQTQIQLDTLKKFCKTVYVDPDRAEIPPRLPDQTIAPSKSAVDLSRIKKTTYTEQAPVEQEFGRARAIHAASTSAVRNAFVALRAGQTLDSKQVNEAVNGVTESVLRNADAMLLYMQLQQKDDYTQSHALDVSVYMIAFGRFLGMTPEDLRLLGHVGLLQDIGKLRLPADLILKRERLTPEEFELAKRHIAHSDELLRAARGLPPELPGLALLHHERHNGSGYPKGLRAKEIGLIGSIAAIMDTFDALTAQRPYAEAVAPSVALGMLYKWRGDSFDSYLVEQFIRFIGIYPLGSVVELNSGEVGIVIAQNLKMRLQPRVMVTHDSAGNVLKPQKLLDLSRGHKATSNEAYRIRRTLEYGRIPGGAETLFMNI